MPTRLSINDLSLSTIDLSCPGLIPYGWSVAERVDSPHLAAAVTALFVLLGSALRSESSG